MSSVAEKLQRKDSRSTSSKQVRLKLVYLDFWSVVKLSFLVWLCLGIVLVVATILIWVVLYSTGVFGKLDTAFQDILSDPNFRIADSFGLGQVGLFALVVAILNVVVGTVLAAIASLTARSAPKLKLPRMPLFPLAYAAEAVARMTGREPFITADGLRMAKHRMFFSSAKAERGLGYSARPFSRGVEDALRWFREAGYLR